MALHSDLAMPTGTRSVPTKRAAAMRRWPGHGHEAKMAQNQNECRWVGSLDHDKSKVSERWWKIDLWKGPTIAVRPYPCHLWVLHRRLEGYWGMDSAGLHIPNLFFEGESAQYAARKFTCSPRKKGAPKWAWIIFLSHPCFTGYETDQGFTKRTSGSPTARFKELGTGFCWSFCCFFSLEFCMWCSNVALWRRKDGRS